MNHGFNLDSPLVCEGIVGDGCGGGRIFHIENSCLKVYDPQTQEIKVLLENLSSPEKISKKVCIITIKCENETIEFDLSAMKPRA